MTRWLSVAILFCLACALSSTALAKTQADQTPKSQFVSDADYELLVKAFKAYDRRKWQTAFKIAENIVDPTAKSLIRWHVLTKKDSGAKFGDILTFAEEHNDWPRQTRLLKRAEETLPKELAPEQIIAWFAGQEPITGDGKIRLGEAYLAAGEEQKGKIWIEKAWVEDNFKTSDERKILNRHKKIISADAHNARLKRLLWHRQHTAARRVMPYASKDKQVLANARLKLAAGQSPKKVLSSVPKEQRADAGLLYEQVYLNRRRGKDEKVQELLLQAPSDMKEMVRPEKWWIERHLQARKAHREKDYELAYKLAASSGLSRGADFAEAEWLAGWIALRFLGNPEQALAHFQKLETGVSFPISKSRAFYWQGRAAEAMGNNELARQGFEKAASYPYTYYGQLALVHPFIDDKELKLPEQPVVPNHLKWNFAEQEQVKAIQILNEHNRRRTVRTFFYHMADIAQTKDEFLLLSNLALDLGYPNHSIRVTKKAMQKHIPLIEHSYPTIELSDYKGRGAAPDTALVFGLSRQESEFNPKVVSHAGAHGLMQLLPSTARITARKHGLKYRRAWLTQDPEYNTQVGMAHLSDLLDRFDGSYIMTIASYNAGALRIDDWILNYGDPREAHIDAIDWVESIPYKETRNYVQRVLENTQVYRNRITQTNHEIMIVEDLNRSNNGKTGQPPQHANASAGASE